MPLQSADKPANPKGIGSLGPPTDTAFRVNGVVRWLQFLVTRLAPARGVRGVGALAKRMGRRGLSIGTA